MAHDSHVGVGIPLDHKWCRLFALVQFAVQNWITDLSEYVVMIHEIYSAVVGDQKLPQLLPSEPSNNSVEDIGRGIMRPNDSVDDAYSSKLCPQWSRPMC